MPLMRTTMTAAVVLFSTAGFVAPLGSTGAARADDAKQATPVAKQPIPSQEELDRRFEETLSGSQLVGFFTQTGDEKDKPLKEDKYTIEKVKKLKNDYWLFEARIQYNNQDTKVPMPLEVKWAGDTPVITLTNVLVPGLGTFTARVLIYGGEYAGTWSAGDHGGHMFGKIVKVDAAKEDAAKTDAKSDTAKADAGGKAE